MKTITASEAKQSFGEVILNSQHSPVSVTKNGKPVAVVISEVQYNQMKLENLRAALIVGEKSGDAGPLDMEAIKKEAKSCVIDQSDQ